jgi:hypothetical protein
MKKIMLVLLATAVIARADIITENFATNPAAHGWQVFGNTNLFHWDSTNQNLDVTWDSSQPNSYFYHALGTILGRDDDFQVSFELQFNDIAAGVNTNKPDGIEVGIGFLNFGDASGAFVRGAPVFPPASPDPKNVAEFDYFPAFDDPFFGHVDASIAPTFISSNFAFDGAFGDFFVMTNGVSYNVQLNYTASNATFVSMVTLTGQTNVLIYASATLSGTNDFRVDTFSVSSYTDTGDDFDSLLAHGIVGNLVVTTPPSPVQNVSGGFTNNAWQMQLTSRTNWIYTLERTGDFQNWAAAATAVPGNGTTLTLQDTNDVIMKSFYRVRAQKP